MVGKVPNHVDAIETSIGRGVRDPDLEFRVEPVEEEDRACWLRDRHRGNRRALVEWQRVLQGIPKDEVAIAIVGREVGSRIVELDLRILHYISDDNW